MKKLKSKADNEFWTGFKAGTKNLIRKKAEKAQNVSPAYSAMKPGSSFPD